MKRTPLFTTLEKLQPQWIEFGGWEMPLKFTSIKEEHLATRKSVGLFDVSHMGEVRLKGPEALACLEKLTTNFVGALESGRAQYSLMLLPSGKVIDDIYVYCLNKGTDYLVCVNASNTEKDFRWMTEQGRSFNCSIENESALWGQVAVQGPQATRLMSLTLDARISAVPKNGVLQFSLKGQSCYFAHTGYTGESGGEVFCPAELTPTLWDMLSDQTQTDVQVKPCGLGARDTLRIEMKYPLYGHELSEEFDPLSAGLDWAVKITKKDFIGKEALLELKAKGIERKLIGFEMVDRGIPRQGYGLFDEQGQQIGFVTSGTQSISLDRAIGIGYASTTHAELGKKVWVDIRGRKLMAKVCETPFVKHSQR
jgi:aminomethyltransferase